MNFFNELFNGGYLPQGETFLWRQDLLFLHAVGDLILALGAFALSAGLMRIATRQNSALLHRGLYLTALVVAFTGVVWILDCLTIWFGYYHLEGLIKLLAALAIVWVALSVNRLQQHIPAASAIEAPVPAPDPDPATEQAQLLATNRDLESRLASALVEIESLTLTDELTGLRTERELMLQLEKELARARRYKRELSVLAMEIDAVDILVEDYGQVAADTMLRHVASLIIDEGRSSDTVGRCGKYHMIFVLPETSQMNATTYAKRLLREVKEIKVGFKGDPVSVTCSAGIAAADVSDTPELIIDSALSAMFEAKATGDNAVMFSDEAEQTVS